MEVEAGPVFSKSQWKRIYWTLFNRRVWIEGKIQNNLGFSSADSREMAIEEMADFDELLLQIGATFPDIQELLL